MIITPDKSRQQACTVETIAWLHQVWLLTEQGQELQPDPFYDRNALLTPEIVANVIGSIEALFVSELTRYPGYHNSAQGISVGEVLVPPRFDKLPYQQQFAVVQGIDRIFQGYKADDDGQPLK